MGSCIHREAPPPQEDESSSGDEKNTRTKKKRITLLLKRQVWATYIGEELGRAKCLCCGMTDITQLSFHCGHIVAESCGGELTLENLRPICQSCNSSMGTQNMIEYMAEHGRTLPPPIKEVAATTDAANAV